MDFESALLEEICGAFGADYRDNFDSYRFAEEPPPAIPNPGLLRPYAAQLNRVMELLADQESRRLLVKLMAFRVLGHRRVRLPLSTPAYWEAMRRMETLANPEDSIRLHFHGWELNRFDLKPIGLPLEIYTTAIGAYAIFLLPQYALPRPGFCIATRPGDVVIDAGGCWGDSALYFACATSEHGRVYSFEFEPENLAVFRRNLAINPVLAQLIRLTEAALLDRSCRSVSYSSNGPATQVGPRGAETAPATTLDDFVEGEGVARVDFIKMDIEGAEPLALKGAVRTLQRFRPRLAIAVYHSMEDLVSIPDWISSLDLGYKLYLGHASIHAEETVLFADAQMM